MDNLTHSLVGLVLARVGLEKTTPRGTAMMVLAANAPDIDAVFWFGGMLPYLEYHRTYPHAFLFAPAVALLPMMLTRAHFSWRAFAASLAGVVSHLLLDWTNSYGIPFALPFSSHRFRLDTVNLVDLWIWGILLGSLAATGILRLVNREIGVLNDARGRKGWAWAALVLLLAFEGFREATHARALETMAAHLYQDAPHQGAPPQRVTALPNSFSPLSWRGVVEGAGFAIILPVSLTGDYDPLAGRVYREPAEIPGKEAALGTPPFRAFSRFAQVPFWTVTPVEDGFRLDLLDLRFGNPGSPGFANVTAIVDRSGKVLRSGFGL